MSGRRTYNVFRIGDSGPPDFPYQMNVDGILAAWVFKQYYQRLTGERYHIYNFQIERRCSRDEESSERT